MRLVGDGDVFLFLFVKTIIRFSTDFKLSIIGYLFRRTIRDSIQSVILTNVQRTDEQRLVIHSFILYHGTQRIIRRSIS